MAGLPYDPAEVEARWQAHWDRHPAPSGSGEPFYNLVEFPYPSAEGLHAGHVMSYCGADVVGRYQRMRGRAVFQPIGFDSFGINAENYALKAGEHPAAMVARTAARYRRQLTMVGGAWDWGDPVLMTSDPRYYHWTQWLFVQLYRAGLAYQADAPVVWCPSCATVLADEQVEDDRCERCDTPVTERVMHQWFLRMTAYRDRPVAGLDHLDWPDRAKNAQRRWLEGMHDWLISRQRYWGPPIPVVHCGACGPVAAPERDLPVMLPAVADPADIRPSGTGRSPLASIDSFVSTTCPTCGGPARRETDVSDTFFDSSWYFLRYRSAGRDDVAWSPGDLRPVDLYVGGPEHVARHHLYARFVTMALHDLGLVPFAEPFPRLRLHGVLTRDGAKMSKSRGNVVDPEDYVRRHGGDIFRTHLLSSGRWAGTAAFRDTGIVGVERLFTRLWRLAHGHGGGAGAGERSLAEASAEVGAAIEGMRFNVAVTALGGLARVASPAEASTVALLLAPFAPFLAEELWAATGGAPSVHAQPWPRTALPVTTTRPARVELVVQVDGRVRDRVQVPAGLSPTEARARAEAAPNVVRHLGGRPVARCVHVPDRLVNLVTVSSGAVTGRFEPG